MNRSISVILIAVIAALLLLIWGLQVGSVETTFEDITALFSNGKEGLEYTVIWELRLPRLLLAWLIGGTLAYSGYLVQNLFNNPLADPYILGTSSGASLGANLIHAGIIPVSLSGFYIPTVFAFGGALLVTLLAVSIAHGAGRIQTTKLLLAGLALSSLSGALLSLLIFLGSNDNKLKSILAWTMGNLERADWDGVKWLLALVFFAVLASFRMARNLDLMLLGDKRASSLGLEVNRFRWEVLLITALLVGSTVSLSGPIGFVGLMVPHFTRALCGGTGKYNLLVSIFIGGAFLMACDILSRIIYPPAGIPIGVITSFLGIPFFVYLLYKNKFA